MAVIIVVVIFAVIIRAQHKLQLLLCQATEVIASLLSQTGGWHTCLGFCNSPCVVGFGCKAWARRDRPWQANTSGRL